MSIGVSLFVFAVGAVLDLAVTVSTPGINLPAVGVILMIVGAVGFVTALVLEFARRPARRAPAEPVAYAPERAPSRYGNDTAVESEPGEIPRHRY